MEFKVSVYRYEKQSGSLVPYFDSGIQAGFPSPAVDSMERAIDLQEKLIKNPSSTFIGRVSGTSMKDIGIFDQSLAIIDKSLKVYDGNLVVAWVDDGFTLKRIHIEGSKVTLMPFNRAFKPIPLDESNNDCVWGKVTYIINPAL